ncbi:MAG: DUF2087 domain-containing protein [Candidatus Nanoarchaeia archaeon]
MIELPRDDVEKQEILSKIMEKFEDKKYNEDEVNSIIQGFDVDDYALVRRELVNFGYLGKDSYEGTYWVKTKKLSSEEIERIRERQGKIAKID